MHTLLYSTLLHPILHHHHQLTLLHLKPPLAHLINQQDTNNILRSLASCSLIPPNITSIAEAPAVLLITTLQSPNFTLGAHIDFYLSLTTLDYDIAICDIKTAQSNHSLLSDLCFPPESPRAFIDRGLTAATSPGSIAL